MYLVWIRPQWAAMFRIFYEQETSRKISHLTPDYRVYKTKAFPCSCAEKNWYSRQLSPSGCRDADRNGNVTVGWAGGSGAVIHSHPALSCSSGNSQGTNAPLPMGTLPSAGPGTSLRFATLSCWRARWQFFTWALKLLFILSHCMAKGWAEQKQYPPASQQITSRHASLYLPWSAVQCIFISPWYKTCLSAKIL